MVTHAPNTDEQVAAPRTRSRIRPYQVVIGIGIAFAIFTALSGLVPRLTKWHEEEGSVGREVFGGIPDALMLVFYTITPVLLIAGALLFAQRVKNWERGGPDNRPLNAEERSSSGSRTSAPASHADAAAGPGRRRHALADLLRLPRPARRHDGAGDRPPAARGRSSSCTAHVYQGYSFVGDLAGLVFLGGVAVGDRPPLHPAALPHPHQDQARARRDPRRAVALIARHRLRRRDVPHRRDRHARRSRSGRSSATRCRSWSTAVVAPWTDWHQVLWIAPRAAFFTFLVILPVTMLRHMFTSPLNMYLRDRSRPEGCRCGPCPT